MITYVVASVGRPSLLTTLSSIECLPGDEILLVSNRFRVSDQRVKYVDCLPGRDWGHTERNYATPFAQGRYIAHIDDDDVYVPGARALMEDAIKTTPRRPVLFRMRYPNGITLWQEERIVCGNVGTPMMLVPNRPTMLGRWGSFVGGDCHFLETCKWKPEDYVWRPEVTVALGHNVGD